MVGIGLVLFLLGPIFQLNPLFGAILPVGFEGGHGTAVGAAPVFGIACAAVAIWSVLLFAARNRG